MASQVNAGKLLLLEISEDAGSTWLTVGGIKSKGVNFDNPVIDATNQSTASIANSDFTESVFNGFSTVTINGDGVMDKRFDATTISAYTLLAKATSGTRTAYLRITDGSTGGSFTATGEFTITSFELGGEIQDLETFTMAAQSCQAVAVVVTEPA